MGTNFLSSKESEHSNIDAMHHASFAGSSQGVGLVLEIFSGTSRLTKACRKAGLRAYAVDKDKKRAENVTVLEFDITNTEQLKQLQDIIVAEGCLCFYAHFAPACGTCSRARERFIPGVPQNQQPAPLRSDEWPSGLPNLQPGDQHAESPFSKHVIWDHSFAHRLASSVRMLL